MKNYRWQVARKKSFRLRLLRQKDCLITKLKIKDSRAKFFCVIGLFLFTLFCSQLCPLRVQAEAELVKIVIPSQVESSGEEVFLSDVAKILGATGQYRSSLAGISLGRAPRAGQTRWLHRSYVEYALQRSGWAEGRYVLEMPVKVKILGASQSIRRDRLVQVIYDFLREEASESWVEYWIDAVNIPETLSLPPGDFGVTVEGKKEVYQPGTLLLRLKLSIDGKEVRTIPVTVRLHIKAHVLVVQRELERFQVLAAEDFTTELREIGRVDEVVGLPEPGKYRTTRSLRPGDVLRRRDIELAPEVMKGAKVGISLASGSICLSMVGIAMEDGRIGETIRVKNLDSNRIVRAIVTGLDQLEVVVK